MLRQRIAPTALVIALAAGGAACGRSEPANESPEAPAMPQPGAPADTSTGDVEITFRSEPDPPVTGDNTFDVTVREPGGAPVTDAVVTAEFFMPAMPEMKMPEMRMRTPLTHEGDGRYRGRGQVTMAGAWEVTVTVTRGDRTIGSRTVPVTAR